MLVEPINNKREFFDMQYNGKYWITISGASDEVKAVANQENLLLNKSHTKQTLIPQDYEGLSGKQHPHENVPLKRTEYSNEEQGSLHSQTGVIQVWSYGEDDVSQYPKLVRQMPCYEPKQMREQSARPHKLLEGFNSEMYWKV